MLRMSVALLRLFVGNVSLFILDCKYAERCQLFVAFFVSLNKNPRACPGDEVSCLNYCKFATDVLKDL